MPKHSSIPTVCGAKAARLAASAATTSMGAADPLKYENRNDWTPAPSRMVPVAAYDSMPKEWAYEPTGNKPSLKCRRLTKVSAFMGTTLSDGLKWRRAFFPAHTHSVEQADHSRIVRHEQAVAFNRERKMKIPDLEGDADRLPPVIGLNDEKGFTRSFHCQIPVRPNPQRPARLDGNSRREGNANFAAGRRSEAAPEPAALLP